MSTSETQPQGAELPQGGRVLPVVRWGTPVMHRTLEPVTEFDAELHRLVADMVATM
jgi:peptide deformylase